MKRRDYLAAGAALGAAATSGCSSFLAAAETPRPSVPTDRLESGGWAETADQSGTAFESSYGPVTLTAVQHTLQYEDAELRRRVSERSLGAVEAALSVWFASRIDFSPDLDDLPGGVGTAEIIDQVRTSARDQFETQMRDQGLTDIERTGSDTVEIDTGETAETTELSAVYPFEGISFDIGGDESVTVPPTDVGIAATLAVWSHGDYILVSGGAHPAEDFQQSIENDLSEGITVSVDIDLGLEPAAYREEIRSLVAGVA